MADLYSTDVMTATVNSLEGPLFFFYDNYFTLEQTENSEEIHFDREQDVLELAPFVSPLVEGEIVTERGFSTDTITPAYLKPKTPLSPRRPYQRWIGEQIGGTMTPMQRRQLSVTQTLNDHRSIIDRRMEWMAVSVVVNGSVVISGNKYPTKNVDFNRDPSLTIDLGAGSYWGETDVNPLDDLQDWSDLILEASGAVSRDVVMTTDVWKVFRADPNVAQRLDITRGTTSISQRARIGRNADFMGPIDGFNIYVYSGRYVDSAGDRQDMMPAKTVVMLGEDMEGVRAFGAIEDEDVLNATPMYSKSWVTNDPSQRILMTQSAPITYPRRVNATLKAQVLA